MKINLKKGYYPNVIVNGDFQSQNDFKWNLTGEWKILNSSEVN